MKVVVCWHGLIKRYNSKIYKIFSYFNTFITHAMFFKGNDKLLNNNLRNILIKLRINIYYSVLYNAYFQKSNKWLINVKSLLH